MDVKGTAFIARKSHVSREHGAEAFDAVLATVATKYPVFREPILATTRIPVQQFIELNDAIVARLYGGDERSYFRFGEASATWGLTLGPYKGMVDGRDVRAFVSTVPTIYRSYFNDGQAVAKVLDDESAEIRISGIQPPHLYFEYAITGYFARGIELVTGRKVEVRALRGFSRGDADVHYVVSYPGSPSVASIRAAKPSPRR